MRQDYLASYAGDRFVESMAYVRSYPSDLPLLAERLGDIRTPVQIIAGRHDALVPPSNAEFLHARLADSKLDILDTGHFAWEDGAEEYLAAHDILDRSPQHRQIQPWLAKRHQRSAWRVRTVGTHLIVLPGGGYAQHAANEAEPIVDWLNGLGVRASVFRYPLMVRHPEPLDALRAEIRRLRDGGAERIGLIGFSAGGTLPAWRRSRPAPIRAKRSTSPCSATRSRRWRPRPIGRRA